MKTNHPILKLWGSAFLGVMSLVPATPSQAALMPVAFGDPEGSVPLGAGSTLADLGAGTVLDSLEIPWTSTIPNLPPFTGILRSMVVDPGAPGGPLDFYYQVINTSTAPIVVPPGPGAGIFSNDIFRLAIPGYDQGLITVDATYRTDLLAGLAGVPAGFLATFLPNKGLAGAVDSADRDLALNTPDFSGGGAGFDFDPGLNFDTDPTAATNKPQNINELENSNWLVLRTNWEEYTTVITQLTGNGGTGLPGAFAPIPEPSTVLFGLAMAGFCAGGRFRKSRRA